MKCFNCNSEIDDNSIFCSICGSSLANNQNSGELKKVEGIQNNSKNLTTQVQDNSMNSTINNTNIANETNLNDSNLEVNVGFKEMEKVQVKGKPKGSFVIASFLIIVILGIMGFCGYVFLNSPKKNFTNILNITNSFVNKYMNSEMMLANSVSTDFEFKVTGNFKDDTFKEAFDIINKVSLSGKTQIDYKNKTVSLNIDSKYDNSELVNLNAYLSNEKGYVYLNDVYDKYMSTDLEGINILFERLNYRKDIKIIYDEIFNTFINSLKDEYFLSDKVKMSVNGSDATVDKTTLLLNYNNLKTLLNDGLSSLKSNDKFLNSFVNIMKMEDEEITKDSVIKKLDEFLSDINNEENDVDEIGKIILYTQGFNKKFVGLEIENNVDNYGVVFSIINDKKNVYTIKTYDGYDRSSAVVENTGDKYILKFDVDNQKMEFGINLKNFECDLKIVGDDLNVNGSLKSAQDGKKNVNLKYLFEENEVNIVFSYLNKFNETITLPKFSPTINFDDISADERKNIVNEMLKKQGLQSLLKEAAKISGYEISGDVTYDDLFIEQEIVLDEEPIYDIDSECTSIKCIESNDDYDILTFNELKKYHGVNKSYEEAYELLTKYYKNGASLASTRMNGNVQIGLDLALDMDKSSSILPDAKNDLFEAANKYLDKNQTYTISVALQNDRNTVRISINSEKQISSDEYWSNY